MVYVAGKEIDPNELKKGDRFRVVFPEDEYTETSSYGVIGTKSGRIFTNSTPGCVFVLTRKAPALPDHYPPQEGDVWRVGSTEYHVFKDHVHIGTSPYSSRAAFTEKVRLGLYKAVLVYRKGNNYRG